MICPHCHRTIIIPRAPGGGRKPRLRPCSTCGESFSARDLRKHTADCKSEATVAELKKLYSQGVLPAWKVKRLEKIAGWKW
jgi:hypothetical protein